MGRQKVSGRAINHAEIAQQRTHPEMQKGRINASMLLNTAQCAKSDRLLGDCQAGQVFAQLGQTLEADHPAAVQIGDRSPYAGPNGKPSGMSAGSSIELFRCVDSCDMRQQLFPVPGYPCTQPPI
jgi:hypothetical protein